MFCDPVTRSLPQMSGSSLCISSLVSALGISFLHQTLLGKETFSLLFSKQDHEASFHLKFLLSQETTGTKGSFYSPHPD